MKTAFVPVGEVAESKAIQAELDEKDFLKANSLLAEMTSYTSKHIQDGKDVYANYFTFYEQDKIYCRKAGEDENDWEISLSDGQYDKVMSFLDGCEAKDDSIYTTKKIFWLDFLAGRLNDEDLKEIEFLGAEDDPKRFGVTEDGEILHPETIKYSVYFTDMFDVCAGTTEEFFSLQQEECDKRIAKEEISKIGFVAWYYKQHPDEIGKRNQVYNGKSYTMAELDKIWEKEIPKLFHMDE